MGFWSSLSTLTRGSRETCLPSAPGLRPNPVSQPFQARTVSGTVSSATKLQPFVDALSIPPTIEPHRRSVSVQMKEFYHKAHRDLQPTRVWGYNGMWPGPTLRVISGEPISVVWRNRLPSRHFLPIDSTIHGAEPGAPEVRTVVHLHGARVLPESDGHPEAWFSSDGRKGPAYVPGSYRYPNSQPAATLWYHDHAIGITRLNIYAGLAGFYIIHNKMEAELNLPSGAYDIPIMIQDRMFAVDGSLVYPVAENGTHPQWVQEFFGDVNCINGTVAPYLKVEPRKYRFRLLNAANSRFYHLKLLPADREGNVSGKLKDAPPFHQIGTDTGLLETPIELRFLRVSPAERADVIIDFTDYNGKNLVLVNDAPAPYPSAGDIVPSDVLLFKVIIPLSGKDMSVIPDRLIDVATLDPKGAACERLLSVTEYKRATDGRTIIGLIGDKYWDDPITEAPRAGSTEIWSFVNVTEDIHPIHIHAVSFQVLNRQPFDRNSYLRTGQVVYTGAVRMPEEYERRAWKDTVSSYQEMVTRVIAKFDVPPGSRVLPGDKLQYVWHCHMLEHEDNQMMRPYHIVC